jgi:hypothetical protein
VTKTSLNKKKLNLRAQSADIYKNGRIFHEYSLSGLAWNHHRFGIPKNLATAFLPPELATLYSKERQENRNMTVNLHTSQAIPN